MISAKNESLHFMWHKLENQNKQISRSETRAQLPDSSVFLDSHYNFMDLFSWCDLGCFVCYWPKWLNFTVWTYLIYILQNVHFSFNLNQNWSALYLIIREFSRHTEIHIGMNYPHEVIWGVFRFCWCIEFEDLRIWEEVRKQNSFSQQCLLFCCYIDLLKWLSFVRFARINI